MKNKQFQFIPYYDGLSKNLMQSLFLLLFLILCSTVMWAKTFPKDSLQTDTLKLIELKQKSPAKAALFSAIVPGLGQAYNKKYWKIPIVYTAIGTSLFLGFENNKNFKRYKNAYINRVDGDANTIDEFEGLLNDEALEANSNYYQRNRDLSFIFAGVFYILTIFDAAVDAHLFNFPKNDKLSFNLQPDLQLSHNNQLNKGFKLVINL